MKKISLYLFSILLFVGCNNEPQKNYSFVSESDIDITIFHSLKQANDESLMALITRNMEKGARPSFHKFCIKLQEISKTRNQVISGQKEVEQLEIALKATNINLNSHLPHLFKESTEFFVQEYSDFSFETKLLYLLNLELKLHHKLEKIDLYNYHLFDTVKPIVILDQDSYKLGQSVKGQILLNVGNDFTSFKSEMELRHSMSNEILTKLQSEKSEDHSDSIDVVTFEYTPTEKGDFTLTGSLDYKSEAFLMHPAKSLNLPYQVQFKVE